MKGFIFMFYNKTLLSDLPALFLTYLAKQT